MKQVFLFLVLASCAGGCSVTQKPKSDVFIIKVKDKTSNAPVDSARVILTQITDARDIREYAAFTDRRGECRFSPAHYPGAEYQVRTTKKGMVGYYDNSYPDLDRAYSTINDKTGKTIALYLTTDTLNHSKFWASHTARYDIDTLISLLKSNRYPLRSEFPLLLWQDIPSLLATGNDRTLINRYPISALSSGYAKECYLGIIALWFAESARISVLKNASSPFERFPGLTPTLSLKGDPASEPNTVEMMEQASKAYLKWWNDVKTMDYKEGCQINPLEKTNLEWR
jgi:hypothetical protein